MKLCKACGICKEISEFYKDAVQKDGKTTTCKSCRKQRGIAWRAERPDYSKEKARQWSLDNPGAKAEYSRKWAADNPGYAAKKMQEYRAADPDRYAEENRLYRLNNPGKLTAYGARRRAAEKRAIPLWADLDDIDAFYRDAARLTQETGYAWHVDHIVPLQSKVVCGLHVSANLQVIPAADNFRKSNHFTT